MNTEANKKEANSRAAAAVKKKAKMTRSKHNERLLGRKANNQTNVFKIESIELNKRENKIEKKTYEIRSDRGKSCEIISTNIEIIPTNDNDELEERKAELAATHAHKNKSLPRMNKFIDIIDLKRLPAPNSCSYQDDTIIQPEANGILNTVVDDVDNVINKFDLITTEIANKFECNKQPLSANQKDASPVSTRIDPVDCSLEKQDLNANNAANNSAETNKHNDLVSGDLPEGQDSLLDESNAQILSEVEQTAKFLVETTIDNIRKRNESAGEQASLVDEKASN